MSQTAIREKGCNKRLWTLHTMLQLVFCREAPRGRAERYVTAKAKKYLGKVKSVLEAVIEGFAPDASKQIRESTMDVVSLTIAIGVGYNWYYIIIIIGQIKPRPSSWSRQEAILGRPSFQVQDFLSEVIRRTQVVAKDRHLHRRQSHHSSALARTWSFSMMTRPEADLRDSVSEHPAASRNLGRRLCCPR